jgi:hypothetical protein
VRTGPDGGDLSPGAGGWPTIRYFNKATGYDGTPYAKKTDKAMCAAPPSAAAAARWQLVARCCA